MTKEFKKSSLQVLFLTVLAIGGIFSFSNSQAPSNQKIEFFVDWSAQTYLPDDYTGKALPTYGSRITLSATPLVYINENDYVFNWIIDSEKTPDDNGSPIANFTAGKSAGGEHNVYLSITDRRTDKVIKETGMVIPVTAPGSIVYNQTEKGALVPLNATNSFKAGERVDLVVKPFFFSSARAAFLNYQWSLNAKKLEGNPSEPNKLSIDFPEKIPGGSRYDIGISIENPFGALQYVEKKHIITLK